MNYMSIITADIANGPGFRVSLFVSGCARNCKGCFNPASHDPSAGKLFDDKAQSKIFKQLENHWCQGISILGGEPLSKLSDNRKQIITLCKNAKAQFPNKTIWLWSSYTLEEIAEDTTMKDILNSIDVLVDGPFIEEKKDLAIPFRGSANQRIIDVNAWRKTGKTRIVHIS